MNTIQPITVYLDPHATIPSLNYFLHFAENAEDRETVRLFALRRFEIPQKIIDFYPAGIIRTHKFNSLDQSGFYAEFAKLFEDYPGKLSLSLHINLVHTWKTLSALYQIYQPHLARIEKLEFHFYDDGSEGMVNLFKVKQNHRELSRLMAESLQAIKHFPNADYQPLFSDEVGRYLWHFYQLTNYSLMSPQQLNETEMLPLKQAITHYQAMNLTRYQQLSAEQQAIVLTFLNISPQFIQQVVELFQQNNIFMFIGTTLFENDLTILTQLANLHISAVQQYMHPQGKYYLGEGYVLCIKGHPFSEFVNYRLRETFPNAVFLPENIPFEILFMLGCMPKKMGGFISTSYFSLPKENIADVIFLTEADPIKRESYDIFQGQYHLMQSMLELGLLDQNQIHYYTELLV